MGNKDANYTTETQRFIDNTIHCYFSYSSYPEDIRYNYFEHNATIDDPYVKLVYWDLVEPPAPPVDYSTIYNIECNAWYSTFNPEEDLIPRGAFDYDPYWNIGQYCVKDEGEAGVLYDEAKEYVDSGYYSLAESNFKDIIGDFPEDPHAIQSLRELYNIEESNGNNYDSLRLYYLSVITANRDSLLCRSAGWMSLHCLIKMNRSQMAVDWLDSTINVPENTVDSIFAIINLGYIYTHFPDTTLKSALYTTHNEHIQKSYADYKNKREELFEKLLKSSSNETENEDLIVDKNATIMQLAPNPTKEAFNAKIDVETEGYLRIELYSSLGAKISEINLGKVQAGIIERNISLVNQSQGMYYVMIKHNNTLQETKKVIKM
jgi:tetratricopeptide (TPR) repeat protein